MLGGPGLVEYAKGYGVELELEEAVYTTNLWRSKHPFVVNHWSNLKNAALNAVRYPRREFFIKNSSFQVLPDRTGREWLISKLPSGRKVFYCQPKLYESVYGPAIKHLGVDPISKQWTTVYLKPQRIIENRIQALGRDILEPAVKRLQQKGFNPFVTVYDEIVCHEPEDYCNIRLQEMCKIMSMSPEWGPDLPLRAEGYVSERYKKN
jgi:DNA polymerase